MAGEQVVEAAQDDVLHLVFVCIVLRRIACLLELFQYLLKNSHLKHQDTERRSTMIAGEKAFIFDPSNRA